jgi:hypothetical protein
VCTTETDCRRPEPGDTCELDADADDPLGAEPVDEPRPDDGVDVVGDPPGEGVVVDGGDVVVGSEGVLGVGVGGSGFVGNELVGRGGTVTETDVVGTGSVGTTSASATRAPSPAPNAVASSAASLRALPTSITQITPFPRFWLRAQ